MISGFGKNAYICGWIHASVNSWHIRAFIALGHLVNPGRFVKSRSIVVCACTLSAGVYHFRDYTARYRGNGACTFFVRCCFKRPIRIQIAQILGLGIGNLCEAGRPEGLPFFLQNGLKFLVQAGKLCSCSWVYPSRLRLNYRILRWCRESGLLPKQVHPPGEMSFLARA